VIASTLIDLTGDPRLVHEHRMKMRMLNCLLEEVEKQLSDYLKKKLPK